MASTIGVNAISPFCGTTVSLESRVPMVVFALLVDYQSVARVPASRVNTLPLYHLPVVGVYTSRRLNRVGSSLLFRYGAVLRDVMFRE